MITPSIKNKPLVDNSEAPDPNIPWFKNDPATIKLQIVAKKKKILSMIYKVYLIIDISYAYTSYKSPKSV